MARALILFWRQQELVATGIQYRLLTQTVMFFHEFVIYRNVVLSKADDPSNSITADAYPVVDAKEIVKLLLDEHDGTTLPCSTRLLTLISVRFYQDP